MSYTIKNLREVEDSAPKFEAGDDGLELLAFGPSHGRDGEMINDFWP